MPPQSKRQFVLVDTSYMVFAKWYSTLSWYKASVNPNPDISQIMTSPLFKKKFCQMFEANLAKVMSVTGVGGADVIFAKDCNRSNVWRREYYTTYKESRTMSDNFNGDIFGYVYDAVIPGILEIVPGGVVGADTAEADDVIGVISRHLQRTSPAPRIVIVSNDNDCIQLVDDNTSVINLFMQDVGSRRGGLSPAEYLMNRIMNGDRSDNIPSIASMSAGPGAASPGTGAYALNNLLMNLDNTPSSIREEVIDKFDRVISRGG